MTDSLDYSFMEIVNVQDIVAAEKARGRDEKDLSMPRHHISSIRLQSNKIEKISALHESVKAIGLIPQHIKWLDLSNNSISHIGNALENFLELSVLYLHANHIKLLSEIKPLPHLKKLTSITLFGNPVESHTHYRNFVLYLFPRLSKLDFSVITHQDREDCKTWATVFRNKLKEGHDELNT